MSLVLRIALVLAMATSARAGERWYTFSIGDTPVGYVSEKTVDGQTETVVFARLTRLGKSVEMQFLTTSREAEDGELQSLRYEALLSKQATRLEARLEGDRIHIMFGEQERTIDRGEGAVLGPRAVARMTRDKLRNDGDSIEYAVFSLELQRVARARRRVISAADPIACTSVAAMKIEEVIEGFPATRMLWVDGDATMVADVVPGPFGPMRSCRATREAALAAQGTLPADLYERTLARSNIRIADAAAVDRILLRVRGRDQAVPLPDFVHHNQRVRRSDDGRLVEIRRSPPPAGGTGHGASAAEYLSANAMIESAQPEIVRIAKEIAGGQEPYPAALALTKWVAENMSMDAGIVMAPASELIRDRRATCMGYATLLASLARAAGIGSRIVMGYVYLGAIWGGHAWTEMWIDGRWIPFDAAVYAPGVASAARLAAGASSFQDGGGELNASLALLFGQVEIETVEIETAGRVLRAETVPYHVDGEWYVNPALGLRVNAGGYTIERADATWPSTVVVAFRRGDNTIELHQKPAYPSRELAPPHGTAVFAVPEGATLWVWSAQGPNAEETLRRFLARVEKRQPS